MVEAAKISRGEAEAARDTAYHNYEETKNLHAMKGHLYEQERKAFEVEADEVWESFLQSRNVSEELETEWFDALKAEGVVVFEDEADVAALRNALFHDGKIDSGLVGKDAPVIVEAAGLSVPEGTEVIAIKINAIGKEEIMCKEIMGPVVVVKSYDTFENAVQKACDNMNEAGGVGHTAGIFSNDDAHVRYAAERIPVARLLVNQPTPDAWGPTTNSLSPAVSEGCGSWGNNILSANVDWYHLVNVSTVAMKLDCEPSDGEKLFK